MISSSLAEAAKSLSGLLGGRAFDSLFRVRTVLTCRGCALISSIPPTKQTSFETSQALYNTACSNQQACH